MRTVCLGDSFTQGFGVNRDENWVYLLNTPCSTFINKGIIGDTTGGMLARFCSDAVHEKPNYLFITGGFNDLISGVSETVPQANYFAMVHQAFHNNMIPVVCTAPPFDPDAARAGWPELTDFDLVKDRYLALRNWLLSFANAFDLFHVDFYGEFEKVLSRNPGKDFYIDGIHLTSEGHEQIADIVLKALYSF
ncbi:MAG: GDSL-type esterase/lipase family protein [Clostridiales Family XIII bacterium]|nr:GDSL-type esterase/lipase family protein [Clostridia bacterium]MDY3012078.1 GDSL-type esterase/lipase family protein [Clostridiales Family XIII bacterium]